MKLLNQLAVAAGIFFLQGVQVKAQERTYKLPETNLVVRISREFVHQLTGKHFKHDEPIAKYTFGAMVQGYAHVGGTFDVQLEKNPAAIGFDFLVKGEVSTQVMATRREVQLHTHGIAEFTGRRHVIFDANGFVGQKPELDATFCSSIYQVCSFRRGFVGSLQRGIALTTATRNLPEANDETRNELRTRLTANIEKETDRMIAAMNKVGPLLKKGEQILREQKLLSVSSVRQYLATTEEHLYLSIGPPEHRIPSLPKLDGTKGRPIEMWIAIEKANNNDLNNPILQDKNIAKSLVLNRIRKGSPELDKIVKQIQVEAVGGWLVVTIIPKLFEH
jgi:hypothetical protein